MNCPQLKEVESTTMIIHISPTLEPYRLEISKLAISIHHWYTCSAKSDCLQSDAICGFSEFVIAPQNCQLKKHKPLKLSRQKSAKLYAVYLRDLEDNLTDTIKRLETSINLLRCKIQNILTYTLNTQSKLHPSQTLSTLLETQRAVVIREDTISELFCSPLKVRLKRSLIHDKHFATRPLFEPMSNGPLT